MKHFKNVFFCMLMLLFLSGCQAPKMPKQPDPCPRFLINKSIPPELPQEGCVLSENLSQEESE